MLSMIALVAACLILAAIVAFEAGFPPYRPRRPVAPKGSLLHRRAGPIRVLRGREKLAFVIHGFPECPAPYRDIAVALAREGFDVAVPLLAGLGRGVADVEESGYAGYLQGVDAEWRELAPAYAERHVIAVSAGSLLALELCLAYAGDPALSPSTASFVAPALFVNRAREGIVARPLAYLSRTASVFFKSIGAGLPDPGRVPKDGDGRWMGHIGLYPRQSYEILQAGRDIERRFGGVACPLLILYSKADRVLPAAACARLAARKTGSSAISLRAFDFEGMGHARHNLLLYDSSREWALARILAFIEASSRGTAPSR